MSWHRLASAGALSLIAAAASVACGSSATSATGAGDADDSGDATTQATDASDGDDDGGLIFPDTCPVLADAAASCAPGDYYLIVDGPAGHQELRHFPEWLVHDCSGFDWPATFESRLECMARPGPPDLQIWASDTSLGSVYVFGAESGLNYVDYQAPGTRYGQVGTVTFDFTRLDDVGGVVEGTIQASVSPTAGVFDSGAPVYPLTASFRLCRLPYRCWSRV